MRIRNTVNKVPPKWTPVEHITPSGNSEQHYRCPKIGYAVFDPLPRRCTVHYRKGLINEKHNCTFTIPQAMDEGFPENYKSKDIPDIISAYNEISKSLAYLSAKLDLSSNKACSTEMAIFISQMINIGKQLTSNNSAFEPPNIYSISPTTFKEVLRDSASKIENKMMETFSEDINYANLLADTGTTNRLSVQQFVLSNPNFPSMRYPFANYENINFDGQQYATVFQEAIEDALKCGIKIVSVIADSLPSQTNGIIELLKSHENQNIKAIVHVPCISHLTNRVFADLLASEIFSDMSKYIDELMHLCRSPEGLNFIGKSCPTVSETRWFYLVDILIFFIENANEIQNLCTLKDLDFKFEQISDLYFILHPLYKFSLIIEDRTTKLSMLLPLIEITLNNLKENSSLISTKIGVQIFTKVSTDFLARMLSLPFSLVQTAYLLSPEGRNAIRSKERDFSTVGKVLESIPKATDPSKKPAKEPLLDIKEHEQIGFTQILQALTKNVEQTEIKNQEQEQELNLTEDQSEQIILEENNPQDENSFYSDYQTEEVEEQEISMAQMVFLATQQLMSTRARFNLFTQIREELEKIPIEQRLFIDLYDNIVPNATEFLQEQEQLLGLSGIESMIQKWLFTEFSNSFLEIKKDETMNDYWRRVHQYNEFKDLSVLGVRLSSIGVSEAEVERIFSVQKRMLGQHTFNMGTETLHNRLILRYSWFD